MSKFVRPEDWRNPTWDAKTEFPIGYPVDKEDQPTLLYQSLLGNVYTRLTWRDGSVSRGQVSLDELAVLVGSVPREGWYDQYGKYLGSDPTVS